MATSTATAVALAAVAATPSGGGGGAATEDDDCEAAIVAMAAADPDLDPVWGLLVDAADDFGDDADDADAAAGAAAAAAAVDSAESAEEPEPRGAVAASTAAVPAAAADGDGDAGDSEPSTAASPRGGGGGGVAGGAPAKPRISNVVDKAEVPQERFHLPAADAVDLDAAPPVTRWDLPGCDGFVLDGVLSEAECAALMAQGEGLWSFWDDSEKPPVDFRNAHTIEVRHDAIASLIWHRVGHLVRPSVTFEDEEDPRFEVDLEGSWVPYAVNPRLLFGRYLNGGHFSPHTDGTTVLDFNRRTFYTCVLFLNESPWGGHTRIYSDEQIGRELVPDEEGRLTGDPGLLLHAVAPKAGRMLVFYHRLMHEGVPAAEKFIIRTDILYRRTPERCTAPEDVEAFAMYQEAQLQAEKGACDAAAELFRKAFKKSAALREVYRS